MSKTGVLLLMVFLGVASVQIVAETVHTSEHLIVIIDLGNLFRQKNLI